MSITKPSWPYLLPPHAKTRPEAGEKGENMKIGLGFGIYVSIIGKNRVVLIAWMFGFKVCSRVHVFLCVACIYARMPYLEIETHIPVRR